MNGFVRKATTGSGATAVQVCRSDYGKVVVLKHIGSANTPEGIEKLERKARKVLMEGQRSLFNLDKFDGG